MPVGQSKAVTSALGIETMNFFTVCIEFIQSITAGGYENMTVVQNFMASRAVADNWQASTLDLAALRIQLDQLFVVHHKAPVRQLATRPNACIFSYDFPYLFASM